MKDISLDDLLKAGAHFGHQTSRWNPKMADYIFTVRNNIHIMDLEKTRSKLLDAMTFVNGIASRGGSVLFVATKRQSKNAVREAALAAGQPFVITRWLGGTFTNFRTIQKTIKKMEHYEQLQATGELQKNYTKKERLLIERELVKMRTLFEGIKDMRKLPDAVVIFDVNHNDIAFVEAVKSKVKIIGILDTNSNPVGVDYPIPSNDDAIKAVVLIADALSSAIIDGKQNMQVPAPAVAAAPAPEAAVEA